MKPGRIEVFLGELAALRRKMDCNGDVTPEEKSSGLKRQLFEFREKEKQIQKDAEREIEDFFSILHMKKASLEALKTMDEYVKQEISRLEERIIAEKGQGSNG